MNEYDIEQAFHRIEQELISSMIKNLDRHRAEETELGYNWEQWQVKQLKALEDYKKANRKRFKSQFNDINQSIDTLIQIARKDGNMSQEQAILAAIKEGYKPKTIPQRIKEYLNQYKGLTLKEVIDKLLKRNVVSEVQGEFFKLNTRKLNALVAATKKDFDKAEHAILRMADDQYRKIIFDAQVYANTGAATYEKAVDMATKDFLSHGINCIEYANGARHTVADYAYMAIQTACKRAYLTGEGEKRKEWGISTVIVNKRGNPCPKCLPFCGKILIDDVWSGGSAKDGNYPLMSEAIRRGLYHPRCKDSHTTYFDGVSTPPDNTFTRAEIQEIEDSNKREVKEQYIHRQIEKYSRLEENSLDKKNQELYNNKKEVYKKELDRLQNNDIIEIPKSFSTIDELNQYIRQTETDFLNAITSDEKEAIEFYTTIGANEVNNYLRNAIKTLDNNSCEEIIRNLDSAMKKFDLKDNLITYRAINKKYIIKENENISSFVERIYSDKAYMSTTPVFDIAEKYAVEHGCDIIFELSLSKGRGKCAYINEISLFRNEEYELLVKKNSKFAIKEVVKQGNITIIKAVEQ